MRLQPENRLLGVGVALLITVVVISGEEKLALPPETAGFKAGPGSEIASAQCLLCHSADYVTTQPPLARPVWKAILLKMREKYGAPLPEDKVELLTDYLVKASQPIRSEK